MNKNEIFAIVKNNIVDVLFDVDETAITPEISLKALGANSIDRVSIVSQSMEDLQLKLSMVELGSANNIEGLVDLFYAKKNTVVA